MEEKTEIIVERRVKSTVIRRRKTEVEKPSPVEAAPAPEAEKSPEAQPPSAAGKTPVVPGVPLVTKTETGKGAPATGAPSLQTKTMPAAKPAVPGEISALPLTEEEEEKAKKAKPKKFARKQEDVVEVDLDELEEIKAVAPITRIAHVDRVERVFEPGRGGRRRRSAPRKLQKKTQLTVTKAAKRVVEVSGKISVGDLARGMGVKSGEIIKKLMGMGTMVTVNDVVDLDTATLLAHEFQFEVKDVAYNETKVLDSIKVVSQDVAIISRPPVVTIMGHVDHGKTSLLDAIRETNVTAGEAGGITQHIGAYTVSLPKGKITFLDTPGHEAFTAMRARGASVTDIVILVVAADDGVMPQTIESIDHAKAAKVPIVVAVNKIDKPEANIDRIKRQLGDHGLVPEEWGGETLYALVSAKQKKGIDELLETVLLQAEVLDLKSKKDCAARGLVIEARLDRSRGPVATILIQEGTLHVGDVIVAGQYSGKVRAMTDHRGVQVSEALPSYAAEIMGLDGVPSASDLFHAVPDEKTAAMIVENRKEQKRKQQMGTGQKMTLEDFFAKSQAAEVHELAVVLKADVQGSLEAVSDAMRNIPTEKVKVKIIHAAVGGITESDILLASASNAVIIGFNVRPDTKALSVAKEEGVDVKLYKIIYEMINEVKLAMAGLLAPTKKEKYLGRAEVRDIFTVSKVGTVAGCSVVDGKVSRAAHVRLLRDNVVLYEGKVSSLKRFKDDVKEVGQGFECGLGIEGYNDIKKGDLIEAFEVEYIKQEL